jgi:hypothetical protein
MVVDHPYIVARPGTVLGRILDTPALSSPRAPSGPSTFLSCCPIRDRTGVYFETLKRSRRTTPKTPRGVHAAD